MAANEFEKNARKLMDDFKLRPSAEVWQKVEERIREKKRKRRIVFLILLSGIVLVAAGYGIFEFSNSQNSVPGNKPNLSSRLLTPPLKHDETNKNKSKLPGKSPQTIYKLPVNSTVPDKAQTTLILTHGTRRRLNKTSSTSKRAAFKSRRNEVKSKALKRNDGTVITDQPAGDKNSNVTVDNSKRGPDSTQTLSATIPIAAPADSSISHGKQETPVPATATVKPANKKHVCDRKIKWGMNISVGASAVESRAFPLSGRSINNSNTAYLPSSGSSAGNAPGSVYQPSASQPMVAFKAGFSLKKDLSARGSLLASIQYAYLSDRINTGASQNGSLLLNNSNNLSNYYAGGTQMKFTEHFHFIELPVMYDWRLTGNAGHFLSINAGFSLSYVLSANTLTYDTTLGGIYYHNPKSISRAGVNFLPGIFYHTASKNIEWIVGPQFSFALTRVFKNDEDSRRYFLHGGIDVRLLFPNNKRK